MGDFEGRAGLSVCQPHAAWHSGQGEASIDGPQDFRSVLGALTRTQPDEVYYLAGQSSVGLSFEQPAETIERPTLSGHALVFFSITSRRSGPRGTSPRKWSRPSPVSALPGGTRLSRTRLFFAPRSPRWTCRPQQGGC